MTQEVPLSAPDNTGFAARVRSALAWRWGSQVLAQAITWSSTFLVIRILDPSDYGLFAMTQAVLTALAFLNGYSFATSLVQSKDVSEHKIRQVFGMLIVAGAGLAIAQWLLAPAAAAYYGQPMVAEMLRIQAIIFLTTPFIALPSALLARRIEFKSQGLVNMLCALTGALTALGLAWLGFGVWALVYAPIAMAAVRALGLTISARLLVWPSFNFRGAGEIVTFGGALTLCQLLWIIQSQSDIFIAGRAFDPHDLGIYTTSLFLVLIVSGKFLPPINEVTFPAMSELSKTDQPLAPFFVRMFRTVALVTAPIYIGLALTAEPTVMTLLGDKWAEMVPIIAGLALAMPFFALQIVCSPATNAIGKPSIYVKTSLFGAAVFPAVFLFGIAYGPMGLVYAWWIAAPALLIFTLLLTLPAIDVKLGDLLTELIPVAMACLAMVAAVLAITPMFDDLPYWTQLAVPGFVGATVYAATLWFIWPKMIRETWAMVRAGKDDPMAAATTI